jgi:ribosomal protein S18 acetylase RimI-like enzyme
MAKERDNSDLVIRELRESDIEGVTRFADKAIGDNYYSIAEVRDIFERSQKNGIMCSFVLVREGNDSEILGIRLSYPAGKWKKGKGQGLRPDTWNVPEDSVGYFQSLFIAEEIQGKGVGQKLSLASLEAFKKTGAKAVVCHAWRESPHDSSRRYLQKLGFVTVAVHPKYWFHVDYLCPRCGKPCVCTAEEMIKYI